VTNTDITIRKCPIDQTPF